MSQPNEPKQQSDNIIIQFSKQFLQIKFNRPPPTHFENNRYAFDITPIYNDLILYRMFDTRITTVQIGQERVWKTKHVIDLKTL